MTLVLRSRADITLDAYYRVAWRGEDLRFDAGALARMAACRFERCKTLMGTADFGRHLDAIRAG